VEVLAVDIRYSGWDAALELTESTEPLNTEAPAVRLGFNLVRGLSEEAVRRIEAARNARPFTDLHDAARRANLNRADLEHLAQAGALQALSGHRRHALWQALAAAPDSDILQDAPIAEDVPDFAAPPEGREIAADYHALGLTLGRHPLALLRPLLAAKRFLPSDVLSTFRNGQFARGCGIVTVRQRPGTAKGVMFVTLEDETGNINVIVWPALIDKYRKELLGTTLLGVYGIWQSESGVTHLVAKHVVDLSHLMGRLQIGSRDFA
jgi:error-prone DNA polymerase